MRAEIDEPALRELLSLRAVAEDAYLEWWAGAFRLATSGVSDDTQIHTHLCYSESGEAIDAIARLDADVTSIEAARSHMETLTDLDAAGFELGGLPGCVRHSPRVPSVEEIASPLRKTLAAVPAERLWLNPDCGLETRGSAEVTESLANMVAAARIVRAEILRRVRDEPAARTGRCRSGAAGSVRMSVSAVTISSAVTVLSASRVPPVRGRRERV